MASRRRRAFTASLVAAAACAAAAGVPLACGGGFSVGSGDASTDGPTADAPHRDATGADGATSTDGTAPDAPAVEGGMSDAGPPPGDGGLADASMPITGTVVDEYLLPIDNATVHYGSETSQTSLSGQFSFQDVTPPYSLVVVPAAHPDRAYVFASLGKVASPTLQLPFESPADAGVKAATFGGTTGLLGSTGFTGGAVVFADIAPDAATQVGGNYVWDDASASTYQGQASWVGPSSVAATVYGLRWRSDGGPTPDYRYYGAEMATLSPGVPNAWDLGTDNTPGTSTVAVNETLTANYSLLENALFIRPSGATLAAPLQASLSTSFLVPSVGASFVVCGLQYPTTTTQTPPPIGFACQAGIPAGGTASLDLPPVSIPSIQSTGVTAGTPISWSPIPGGVSLVSIEGLAGAPSYFILTDESTIAVPDLSAIGLGLPSGGASYAVVVYGFAPYTHLADATQPQGYFGPVADLNRGDGPRVGAQFSFGGIVPFTTQ